MATMDYVYIRAWGMELGSFPDYIEWAVEKARSSNAPNTAIYQRNDRSWETIDDIKDADTRDRILALGRNFLIQPTAKNLIERFAKKQCDGNYPCPRCGRQVMDKKPTRNATSRRARVYVCDDCGMLEGIEDIPGRFKLPLSAWAIARDPATWGMPLQLSTLMLGSPWGADAPLPTRINGVLITDFWIALKIFS